MLFPPLSWVLFLAAALVSSIGFYKFVYFMSVGYGLAVAGIGAAICAVCLARGSLDLLTGVLCLLLVVYGIRLGGFLLVREMKSAAYRKTLASQTRSKVPFPVMAVMWLCMSALYWLQTCPVWYRASEGAGAAPLTGWAGAAIMLAGICLEAAADRQKSALKEKYPGRPAMEGLYRICRCPNYFGEMTFWTGVLVSGLGILRGLQWIPALTGYVSIFFIMVSGAKRLEKRQNRNYGDLPEYRAYAEKTPILFPFVPLYHLVNEEDRLK